LALQYITRESKNFDGYAKGLNAEHMIGPALTTY
jgi:hypothetical protein